MRHLAIVMALALVPTLSMGQAKRDENEVTMVPGGDPEMNRAIEEARKTLDDFLALAARNPPDISHVKLKVMIKDRNGTEHFWVTPFRRNGAGFQGVLANEPKIVKNVRHGQQIDFQRSDITDWGYVRDGKQFGSYTICVLLKRAPKDQAEYYRREHGFQC